MTRIEYTPAMARSNWCPTHECPARYCAHTHPTVSDVFAPPPEPTHSPVVTLAGTAAGYALILLALVALWAMGGCMATESVPVYLIDARHGSDEYDFGEVEDACEWWGVECHDHSDRGDAVIVIMTDGSGRTSEDTSCAGLAIDRWRAPAVWTGDDDALIHELGHAFGLDDLGEDAHGNVMAPALRIAGPNPLATPEQRDLAQEGADKIARRLGR